MQIFWTILVAGILLWYAITVVIVSIHGVNDLKQMFLALSKDSKD